MKEEKLARIIHSFNRENFKILTESEIEALFEDVQYLFFYGAKRNYWKIKPCKEFVKQHNLPPEQLIYFFETLFKKHYPYRILNNGQKGAYAFLQKLKKSSFFCQDKSEKKFSVSPKERLDFLNDMKAVKQKYGLGNSQEEWIRWINEGVDTGYKYSTLRKTYIDEV